MMKKFSIVIPTYEKPEILYRVLENLNKQVGYGIEDYEVIVVDDGSKKKVFSKISDINTNYALKYIYLDREKTSCRSRTRNMGWKAAEGEIIIFLDDDILVPNNYLQELGRLYASCEKMIVIGTRLDLSAFDGQDYNYKDVHTAAYDEGKVDILETRHASFSYLSYNIAAHRFPWLMLFTCNMAIPKHMLEEVGGFCEKYVKWGWEDLELGYKLYQLNYPIVLNLKIEGLHIPHKSGGQTEDNSKLFYSKFPEASEGMSYDELTFVYALDIISLINRNKPIYNKFKRDRGDVIDEVIINYKDSELEEDIKRQIENASKKKGLKIIVNDYIGDSQFHLWIQLLRGCKSVPLYYPKYLFDEMENINERAMDRMKRHNFL